MVTLSTAELQSLDNYGLQLQAVGEQQHTVSCDAFYGSAGSLDNNNKVRIPFIFNNLWKKSMEMDSLSFLDRIKAQEQSATWNAAGQPLKIQGSLNGLEFKQREFSNAASYPTCPSILHTLHEH